MAILWACETFRPYVIGFKFTIETDHASLQWLAKSEIPRLMRWNCRLAEFDYDIKYRSGKNNQNADILSRLPLPMNSTLIDHRTDDIMIDYNLQDISAEGINL